MSFSDLINAAHDKAVVEAVALAVKPVQDALDQARKDLATAQTGYETAASTSARRITELEADKNAAQARVTILEAEVAALKTQVPPTPAYVRPEGADIVKYEMLASKASVGATAAGAGAKQVSFPAGTFESVDFAEGASEYGTLFYTQTGVRGSGVGRTIFRMKAGSSTKKSMVPADNPPASNGKVIKLWLARQGGGGAAKPIVSGFTLEGTDQGHIYNGFQWYEIVDGRAEDILVKGVPGAAPREPGETFPFSTYRCTNSTLRRVEVDGRNAAGVPVSASGFGINFGGGLTFEDCNAHHVAHAHGFALYDTKDLTFVRPQASNVGLYPMNFEHVSGTVKIDRPKLTPSSNGYHLAIATNRGGTAGTATYTITDPEFTGPKFHVIVTGYDGKPRTQSLDTIKLYVAGVERPDLLNVVPGK